MSYTETPGRNAKNTMNIDFMRSLVKQYSELGQWTSALFWADAAASAAADGAEQANGDDIWLLASAMLSRGELHRAAQTVTSRGLHKTHLLCLGVVMRAYLSAKEPTTVLNVLDEADPILLETRHGDQTHNRALAAILVNQARALSALERREAAAKALSAALQADCACFEALDLLLEQHALTPREERELIESLDINGQLGSAEAALLNVAYRERLLRYTPPPKDPPQPETEEQARAERVLSGMCCGAIWSAARAAGGGRWAAALRRLHAAGDWPAPDLRAAALLELRKAPDLFALAHTLVDAYPTAWTSWFAVGLYYYLIGKSEFARRYLSKAKSLEPSAGCVWLAYGHSFAADNEHDQAMAAYFKASQLMPGCYLPPLYVAVECSLLNNFAMCERFLLRAAMLHNDSESVSGTEESMEGENECGWERISRVVVSPHVAHEAGAAAHAAGDYRSARTLLLRALQLAQENEQELSPCWAATMEGIGHCERALGSPRAALTWHGRAAALRPGRGGAARALALALCGAEGEAARVLHAALARDPGDVVAHALLDAILDRVDAQLTDEEIPQFPFPRVNLSVRAPSPELSHADNTNVSDMSMSFD